MTVIARCLALALLLLADPLLAQGLDRVDSPTVVVDRSALRRAAATMPSETTAGPGRLPSLALEAPACEVGYQTSFEAFNVATYFSWYSKRSQFRCMSARPLEGFFRSANRRRIREHLRRLSVNGFDGIAGVIYADPAGEGREAREMRWMRRAVRETQRLGLQFLPLYDFSIATHVSAELCNVFAGPCPADSEPISQYNFDRHPILQRTVVENLVMIAEKFILPNSDLERPKLSTARFLRSSAGGVVRDERGLPRPEIYIYIPRAWSDDSGFATIARVLQSVEAEFRARGLGRPAYTLDVLVPYRPTFDPDLVAAFGDSAIRLTAFFAVSDQAEDLGELARQQRKMYRRARRKLQNLVNQGRLHPRLQIAVGTAVNFDKRAWAACHDGFLDLAWPARSPEDWASALLMMVEQTVEPICSTGETPVPGQPSYQNSRIVYAGEGFESTWLCAERGPVGSRYPNRYGCGPLVGFGELMRQIGER